MEYRWLYDVPSAPAIKEIIPGNGQLLVYFYPPILDGGTPITGYEYSLGGSSFIFVRNTVSPMIIRGLTNGQLYQVVIRAVNIVGHGPPSEPVEGTPVTAPSSPTNINITPGDRQLSVAFTTPSTGGSPIIDYQYSVNNGSTFTSAGTTVSPITIDGLTNGQSYQVVIRAINSVGSGYPSTMVLATPVTVPSHPIITGITPGNEQLTVYFIISSDGGSPITGYRYSVNGVFVPPVTDPPLYPINNPIIIGGLTNGTTYSIVIQAINRIGEGTSEPVDGTPATVPGAPQITGIISGNGQLTVTFTPPSTGGSPITGYQYSVGASFSAPVQPLENQIIITGLTNGTTYPVIIQATNIIGAGAPSNTEEGTPATVPDAPRITRIIPGDQQLTVYFTPPFNGGSPITGYQYSTDNGIIFAPSVEPVNNVIIIGGLTNGIVYQVIIRAVNEVGDGANSNMVTKYPVAVPGAPTIIQIYPISGTLGAINLLVFYTPPSSGGSPIVDYQYSLDGGYFISAGLNNPITISGLTINTTYQIAIRASNSVGAGDPSIAVPGTTTPEVPFPPTITNITPGNAQLTVAFDPPVTDGGSPITSYAYTANNGSNWGYATVSPIVITGLTNGQTYPVVIRAGNMIGYGNDSNIVEGTPATVPSAPTITSVIPGTEELSVVFTPPTSDGGSTINGYGYSTDNGLSFTPVDTTVSPITITGLTNCTTYQVIIKATNIINGDVGIGAPSNMVTVSPGAPFAPTITGITPGNGQLFVTFTAPTSGPTPTGYQYSTNGGTFVSTTGSPFIISGLTNGTTYQVIVRAFTSCGNGAYSIAVSGTPGTVPDAPTISEIIIGNGTLSVAFTPPSQGAPFISYQCTATPATGSPVIQSGTTSPIVISGLINGTSYSVVVRAVNSFGTGPNSEPLSAAPATVPNAPVLFGILSGNGQLSVGFCPVPDGGSPVTGYQYTATPTTGPSINGSATTSPVVINGLNNGISYSVVVRAVNIFGSSINSNSLSGIPGTPSAPRISGITPGIGQLSVTFFPSTSNGGFTINGYEYSIDNGVTFPYPIITVNPFTITGLTNGTAYPIVIRAINHTGPGPSSLPVSGTPVTTPSAPTITVITPGVKELSVTFTPPFNGGSAITGYQYSTDNGANYRAGTTSPMTITVTSNGTPLTDGTTYQVIIRAINAIGNGAPSTMVPGTTSIVPPSAPTITGIISENGQLSITFTPPTSMGGGLFIGYEYSLNNGFFVPVGSTTSSLTIPNLSNNTLYHVRIRALNILYPGVPSNEVDGTPGVPSAPTITKVIPGYESLTIDYIPSTSDGGFAIITYQYSVGGSFQYAGFTNPIYITGLTNATPYSVVIRATNSNGGISVNSNTVKGTPGTPSAPTITYMEEGNQELTVTFTPSTSDGGVPPITGYQYSIDNGVTFPYSTTTNPFTISGLTNGTTYQIVIRATNPTGPGVPSIMVPGTPSTIPSAPIITGITPGNGQLSIAFTPPSNGGSAITGYQCTATPTTGSPIIQSGITSPIVMTGLSNDTPYSVVIEAMNSNGSGPSSTPVSGTPGVPTAPTITGITSGNQQLLIYFTPPSSDGGSPILNSLYSTDGVHYNSIQTITSPITITLTSTDGTPLINGTSYSITMKSLNQYGSGAPSNTVSGTPIGAPSAPIITGITSGNGQLSVAFTAPTSTGGSAITGYQYSTDNGTSFTSGGQNSPITFIVTSTDGVPLTNGTTYPVVIRATNSIGAGASSTPVNGTPSTVPSAPFITGIVPGNGQLIVAYCPPISDSGSTITNYLYSTDNGVHFALTGMNNPFTITGLTNGTLYQIVIRALNSNGGGDYSNMVVGTPA